MSDEPQLAPDVLARIAELEATRPRDGRRVTLLEKRGGWRYTGITGVCERLSEDGRNAVIVVEHDPQDYWPVGMKVLAELDSESIPIFSRVRDPGELIHDH